MKVKKNVIEHEREETSTIKWEEVEYYVTPECNCEEPEVYGFKKPKKFVNSHDEYRANDQAKQHEYECLQEILLCEFAEFADKNNHVGQFPHKRVSDVESCNKNLAKMVRNYRRGRGIQCANGHQFVIKLDITDDEVDRCGDTIEFGDTNMYMGCEEKECEYMFDWIDEDYIEDTNYISENYAKYMEANINV